MMKPVSDRQKEERREKRRSGRVATESEGSPFAGFDDSESVQTKFDELMNKYFTPEERRKYMNDMQVGGEKRRVAQRNIVTRIALQEFVEPMFRRFVERVFRRYIF